MKDRTVSQSGHEDGSFAAISGSGYKPDLATCRDYAAIGQLENYTAAFSQGFHETSVNLEKASYSYSMSSHDLSIERE